MINKSNYCSSTTLLLPEKGAIDKNKHRVEVGGLELKLEEDGGENCDFINLPISHESINGVHFATNLQLIYIV